MKKINDKLVHVFVLAVFLGLFALCFAHGKTESLSLKTSPSEKDKIELSAVDSNDYFTLIVLPDTQIYPHDDPNWRRSSRKEVFVQQTKWIAENTQKENMKFVLHVGDIVQYDDKPYQWRNANEAMSILDGVVPYCFVVGNHDMAGSIGHDHDMSDRNTTNFNKTFPYSRYEKEDWYGGRMENDGYAPKDNYDNSYHFFSSHGMDFMIVSIEVAPTDEMLDWANEIIDSNADKRVIVVTHSYMLATDKRDASNYYIPPTPPGNVGEQIWQKLIKKHANIFFVLSGHRDNSPTYKGLLVSTGDKGNIVYQLLCGDGYDGWLRILKFLPSMDKILVRTYSPWEPNDPNTQLHRYDFSLPNYNTDEYHQYELTYSMN